MPPLSYFKVFKRNDLGLDLGGKVFIAVELDQNTENKRERPPDG
jgi:hypothetical protein